MVVLMGALQRYLDFVLEHTDFGESLFCIRKSVTLILVAQIEF